MQGFLERRKLEFFKALCARVQFGTLMVTLPDGGRSTFGGVAPGPSADIRIKSAAAIPRMFKDGKLGFCEAVMRGEIESDSLPNLIELALLHRKTVPGRMGLGVLRRAGLRLFHAMRRNSKQAAPRNIAHHYDLGNAFYASWLDSGMTYSSAVFEGEDRCLDAAQQNKYRHLADLADIQPGDSVLEIGCGWGGFAEYAARERGARVTAITISREQHDFAVDRLGRAGLGDRAEIRLVDYRDVEGMFDKIVSIEMFEAVGMAYWATYFRTLSSRLKPGGRVALQTITIEESSFDNYSREPDFIQRYIFPGGMLPSLERLESPLAEAGLRMARSGSFGRHYARTLEQWRARFHTAWPGLDGGGFDADFRRMWDLYLAYCEGGFRAGVIDVNQMLLVHK